MLTNKYSTSAFHPVRVCEEQLHYESLFKHQKITSRNSKQQWVGRARVCCHVLPLSLSHLMTKYPFTGVAFAIWNDEIRRSERRCVCVCVCVCWGVCLCKTSNSHLVLWFVISAAEGWRWIAYCAVRIQTCWKYFSRTCHLFGLLRWQRGSLGPGLLYST